jgi:hypothetical protein
MSTNAMIGMKIPDGSVHATYLHNDGYVLHAGYTLATFYATAEKVRALLSLGDLSAIAERLAPAPNEPHTFAAPAPNVTVTYHRDRGEALRPTKRYTSPEAYLAQAMRDTTASFLYLFDDGRWLYASQATAEFIEVQFTTGE